MNKIKTHPSAHPYQHKTVVMPTDAALRALRHSSLCPWGLRLARGPQEAKRTKNEPSETLQGFLQHTLPTSPLVEAFKRWMSTRGPELSEWKGPDSAPWGSQKQRWDKAAEALTEKNDEHRRQDRKREEQQLSMDGWGKLCADHPGESDLGWDLAEGQEVAAEQWWDGKVAEAGHAWRPLLQRGTAESVDLDPEPVPWRVDTDSTNSVTREGPRSCKRSWAAEDGSERKEPKERKQTPRSSGTSPKDKQRPVPKPKADGPWQQKPRASQASQAAQASQASPPSQPSDEMPIFGRSWAGSKGWCEKQRCAHRKRSQDSNICVPGGRALPIDYRCLSGRSNAPLTFLEEAKLGMTSGRKELTTTTAILLHHFSSHSNLQRPAFP